MERQGKKFRLDTAQDIAQAPGLALVGRQDRDGIPFDLAMYDIIA